MSFLNLLKDVAKKKLTNKHKKFLRNILEPPFLYSQLSKHSILILGCQRSGTTLTFLILNSHPQVKGIDETESGYSFPHQNILYRNWIRNYVTCFKLPNQTFNLEYITQHYPKTKIIWLVRNPYRVVSSMRSFLVRNKTSNGDWLNICAKEELLKVVNSSLFPDILSLDLGKLDEVSLGAYLWKYKHLAINKYRNIGLDVFPCKYEELLNNPRTVISNILEFVGLNWDDAVLNHHRYQHGKKRYPGGTLPNKPIDILPKQRQLNLSPGEIELITSICKEQMVTYGYQQIPGSI